MHSGAAIEFSSCSCNSRKVFQAPAKRSRYCQSPFPTRARLSAPVPGPRPPSTVFFRMSFEFQVDATDGRARAARFTTPHGVVEGPAFMAVGTLASVKGLDPDDLHAMRAQMILANAYHLHLRPGDDVLTTDQDYPRMLWLGVAAIVVLSRRIEDPIAADPTATSASEGSGGDGATQEGLVRFDLGQMDRSNQSFERALARRPVAREARLLALVRKMGRLAGVLAPLRVVLVGSECTGKTDLAEWLAAELRVPMSAEYAREYAMMRGGGAALTAADVESIARGQLDAEEAAIAAAVDCGAPLVVHDTDLLSTMVYATEYYGIGAVPAARMECSMTSIGIGLSLN